MESLLEKMDKRRQASSSPEEGQVSDADLKDKKRTSKVDSKHHKYSKHHHRDRDSRFCQKRRQHSSDYSSDSYSSRSYDSPRRRHKSHKDRHRSILIYQNLSLLITKKTLIFLLLSFMCQSVKYLLKYQTLFVRQVSNLT